MKRLLSFLILIVSCSLSHQMRAFDIKNWWHSWFGTKKHHKIITREYEITTQEKFCLHNNIGSINLKTNWKQNKILLTATIKGSCPEELDSVSFKEKKTATLFELCTQEKDAKKVPKVDFELILPTSIALELVTQQGNILLKQTSKPTLVSTHDGNIEIFKADHCVIANVFNKGSIGIKHAHNTVKATTNKGNIAIHDARHSIIAHAKEGNIVLHATKVPSIAKIELLTSSGNIAMQLPHDINADVQAHAKKGMVTSSHYITLKPFTTQLTKSTFERFKHEIDGTIGSGESHIYVSSLKGNVAIDTLKA